MLLQKLRAQQIQLAKKIVLEDCFFQPIQRVAGFDLAFHKDKLFCAGVVLDYNTLRIVEKKTTVMKETFPYIPTFLSFREAPPIVLTYKKLMYKPDVLLIDGNGVLHPYKMGIATHVGLLLDKVTVGVAKTLLCGKYKKEPSLGKPTEIWLKHEIRGVAMKTKNNCKPVYVSAGHKISLKTAITVVLKCIKNHKLPEPLRMAHLEARRTSEY
jgi:deoxyribonuclease V